MDNEMLFNYGVERKYRDKLNVDILKSIGRGQLMARGYGTYDELEKYPINWIAVKGQGYDDFAVYYGAASYSHEYIRHNGEKILSHSLLRELLNCDGEVLKLYRR